MESGIVEAPRIYPSSVRAYETMNVATAPHIPPPVFNQPVGPHSTELVCPGCRCRIHTKVVHRANWKTHIGCLLLLSICLCCLPYCMNTCRNANHFCPMCGIYIGTYQS